MGSDDIFKKRREARKKRDFGYKQPRANSYLIVTEGKRTEPLYFRGMQKLITEKMGGTVNIVEIPVIDIHTSRSFLVQSAVKSRMSLS